MVSQSFHFVSLCRSEHSGTLTNYHFSSELGPPQGVLEYPYLVRMLSGGARYIRCRCIRYCTSSGRCSCRQRRNRCHYRCHPNMVGCRNNMVNIHSRRVQPYELKRNLVRRRPLQSKRLTAYPICNCTGKCRDSRCKCRKAYRLCFSNCHPHNRTVCTNRAAAIMHAPPLVAYPKCKCRRGTCKKGMCLCNRDKRWCFRNCHSNNNNTTCLN